MDARTKTRAGLSLLVVGAILVLWFALPGFVVPITVPVPLAILAALGMALGTLLVGTSAGPV